MSPISGIDTIHSFTTTNNTNNIEIATITVEPEYNGCFGDTIFTSITVFPTPVVNPEPDQILCVNTFTNAINFTGTVPNAASLPSLGNLYDLVITADNGRRKGRK